MALGIGPGDEVIMPGFTYIATAESPALLGAKPVFVDIEPSTYNIDPKLLEAAITPKTKCIMIVSLYGQCVDFDEINKIASKHNLATRTGPRALARHIIRVARVAKLHSLQRVSSLKSRSDVTAMGVPSSPMMTTWRLFVGNSECMVKRAAIIT